MSSIKTNELNELLWNLCDAAGLPKADYAVDLGKDGFAIVKTTDGSLPFGVRRRNYTAMKEALEFAPLAVKAVK